MTEAFPDAPIYTTLYEPDRTFPEFGAHDVRPSRLNRHALLRRSHRLALPLLARDVDRIRIDADVVVASSSGWAHGMQTDGRKIVYCHAPARWLYQTDRYAGGASRADGGIADTFRRGVTRAAVQVLGSRLRRWDAAAAASAGRYLVNSTVIQRAVRDIYGIDAEVLPPPPALIPSGPEDAMPGIEPGYLLVVARLLPYKNVDLVIEAAARLGDVRLVVVGKGPDQPRLEALARRSPGIVLLGSVTDPQLRWLYRNALALVAAAYEDYGLAPLEAAAFGRPTVALRDGGFLDTLDEGVTGEFFDEPEVESIAAAIETVRGASWNGDAITAHADLFGIDGFTARLTSIVAEETQRG
jgi:glycosyltransferase involved in cell wall biosynthesis